MKSENHTEKLLHKYISGQSSPEETERVLAWLGTREGLRCLKRKMDVGPEEVFGSEQQPDPALSREIYARIRNDIDASRRPSFRLGGAVRSLSKWKAAAALAGLAVLAGAVFMLVSRYNTVTYTTDYAQKEVIILPDHSTVTLNGNSTLSFSRNWENKPEREVHLKGEAFFEVTRNEGKPFVVTTSEIGIRVLGTSFNVKSYEDEETIETTLVKGKVAISNLGKSAGEEEIVLEPNQKATYSKRSDHIVLDKVRPELYTSWKSGMLIFEDAPFEEIARQLERWYGVRIRIEDEASGRCKFTMKIKDEPLTEVLDLFASTTSASYSLQGKEVTIEGNLCN